MASRSLARVTLVGALLISGISALGSPVGTLPTPVPLDPAIVCGQLPNGLRYYVQHNETPKGQIELRLAVDAGSAVEDEDQKGLAHLIEHLSFRSTRHFPNSELIHYLQSLGSEFGPDINAYTGFDETVYKLAIPADKRDALENGLLMLRDWAGAVSFDQADVDRERKVVIEEWRLGRGPAQRMLQKEMPVLFEGTRYANRLPIGEKTIIEGAPIDAIARFYHDWYRPDNMAVVVVGDVDPQAILARITALFSDLQKPANPRSKPDLVVPVPKSPVYSNVSDPEMGYTAVRIWYPEAACPVLTAADFRRELVRQLVLHVLNNRLAESKERAPAPYEFAQAGFGSSPARSLSVGMLVAIVRDGGVPVALKALIQEAVLASGRGFTEQEFQRGKAAVLKSISQRYAERDHRESSALAAACVANYLTRQPTPAPQWEHDLSVALVDDLTLADMNRASQELLGRPVMVSLQSPQNTSTAQLGIPELRKLVAEAEIEPLAERHEKTLPKTLMEQLPAAGQIVSRKTIESLGITELTLSNGVRVVLKPSTFKQEEIVFSAYRPGGLSRLPPELTLAGLVAPGYLGEAGLGAFSKTDLQKILAGKQAQVSMQLMPCLDVIKGQCTASDLETSLQLIHLAFSGLRRDEVAYKSVVAMNHSFEANVLLNPTLSFLSEITDKRFGHNPRAPHLVQPAGEWEALTLDKVIQAYDERFGAAGGFMFFFVGSFKADDIEPLLARYLGSLPQRHDQAAWLDVGIRQIPGPFEQIIERGSDPKALVVLAYDLPVADWSLHQTHILWSLGNILQRALIDKIRIEQGSAYTLKVQSSLEKIPYVHYSLEVAVPCAPQNTVEVVKVVNAEIDRLRTQGPTLDEIEKEVAAQKHAIQLQAEKNSDWLWKLELVYKYDEGFERLNAPEALMRLVTADNIRHGAATYLATDKWVQFKLTPKSIKTAEGE
jgi:zinc protease